MCFARCPNPRAGREKASKAMQLAKKGKFVTDSSQGSCRIQRSSAGSENPEPQLLHKFIGWTWQLVAGLSGLVTCLQSSSIGTNFRGLLFKLRRSGAFPLSLMFTLFPFGRLLIGWLQAARWGRGILPFQGKPKPRSWPPASPSGPTLCPWDFSGKNTEMGYHFLLQ